jgi:cytochrome c oxidase subunit III
MPVEHKTTTTENRKTFIQKIESLNPHHLFLIMSVSGSAFIFAFLLITFNLSYSADSQVEFPGAFIFSTGLIVIANLSINQTVRYYLRENMHKMVIFLGITLMMGISFLLSQIVAWEQLYEQGVRISGIAFESYLYLLSGLHVLHLLGAMVYLALMFFSYIRASVDPVKTLVMTTNPYQMIRLKMLVTCWNFLDIVWIIIFINFIFVL